MFGIRAESHEVLEEKEEELRSKVRALPEQKRKVYYSMLSKRVKDPDTYAVLIWCFMAGVHNLYLKKYILFSIDIIVFFVCMLLIITQSNYILIAIGILMLRSIIEMPALFASQRIVRQYNYNVSVDLYKEIDENTVT